MVIPEEQPAQPALPIQPEGMRVVCGHCGNTFLVRTPRRHRQNGPSQSCRVLFTYSNLVDDSQSGGALTFLLRFLCEFEL